jgi:hypothetical protein
MASFAALVCDGIGAGGAAPAVPAKFGILGAEWLALTGLALFSSLFILVLVNMLANMLRNQQLLAWSKFELFQVFGTATLVIFSIVWLYGMCNFDMSFLDSSRYPPGMKLDELVAKYFEQIEEVGGLLFLYMIYVIKQVNFLAKAMWTSNPLGIGSVDSPLESLAQINTLFFFMMGGYITSFLLLQLQLRMLEYMAVAGLYFLFPFGIFFRAFEPTRAFGGTLVGIAIAMFFFYPIVLIFNDYLIYHQITNVKTNLSGAAADGNTKTDPAHPERKPQVEDLEKGTRAMDPGTKSGMDTGNALVQNVTGGVMFLLKPIMVYMVAAVVLPLINFIVLVEITRGITHFLGEEIDVSNLTRLI